MRVYITLSLPEHLGSTWLRTRPWHRAWLTGTFGEWLWHKWIFEWISKVCNLVRTLDLGKLIYSFTNFFIKHLSLYMSIWKSKYLWRSVFFLKRGRRNSVYITATIYRVLHAKHFDSWARITKYMITLQLKNGFLQIASSHPLVKLSNRFSGSQQAFF